jgi:hypothetical protein
MKQSWIKYIKQTKTRCKCKRKRKTSAQLIYADFFRFFQLLHIQIFPLTVADTFVTLSWNTSRSLARDFVLQVTPEDDHDPHMTTTEYSNIEVGLKMASYTLSSLRPSTAYTIRLCMKKAGTHLMEAGLEKNPGLKKTARWGFFWVFWVFWCFVVFFLVFLKYFCPEERVFRVFSVSRILLGASRL